MENQPVKGGDESVIHQKIEIESILSVWYNKYEN